MNHASITIINLFLISSFTSTVIGNLDSTAFSPGNYSNEYESRFIFGGHRAHDFEFPYIFALLFNNGENYNYMCCGSLLSPKYLLTAAHCISKKKYSATDYSVLPNYRNRAYPEESDKLHQVAKLIVHPDYDERGKMFDIGLIKLAEPVKLVKGKLFPIKIDRKKVVAGDPVQAAGWGHTNWGRPMFLEAVDLTAFEGEKCAQLYQVFDNQSMLCIGSHADGKDTCQGDSGGPLIVRGGSSDKDRLVGLTSYGRSICGKLPAIYSSLDHYYDWIVTTIGNSELNMIRSYD